MKRLGTALAFAAVMVPAQVLVSGWALSLYWRWFVLPVWPNLTPLSVTQAAGLSLVVGLLRFSSSDLRPGESAADSRERAFAYLVTTVFAVGVAWLIQAVIY